MTSAELVLRALARRQGELNGSVARRGSTQLSEGVIAPSCGGDHCTSCGGDHCPACQCH